MSHTIHLVRNSWLKRSEGLGGNLHVIVFLNGYALEQLSKYVCSCSYICASLNLAQRSFSWWTAAHAKMALHSSRDKQF